MRENNTRHTTHRVKRSLRLAMVVLLMLGLFAVFVLTGCASSSRRTYRAYSGTVAVSLGLGKEGILVEENPFPVTVHIDGDYAEEGSWCVLTVPTNASDYYTYRMPLSEESSQKLSFIVPAAKYSSQITIELLDSEERVIYSRTSTYQAYDEWQNMILAGQMGTQTDTVSWPDEVTHSGLNSTVTVREVTLTEDNLYTQKEGYEMLDFLTMDVSYFETLDADVQSALLEWVKEGGTIGFQGTGAWPMFQRMGITGFGRARNYSAGTNIKLLYRTYGKGEIWSLGGTLSQTVARLTDNRKGELIKALSAGASGSYSEDYDSLSVYDDANLMYRIKQHKTSAETPDVWLYVAFLCIYLGIGIPGVYAFVRRKRKIRWFRPLVCVLAIGFSILIFIVGTDTRYSRPFLKTLTVLSNENCPENEYTRTVYAGIQAPFNSSYEVSIYPEYSIEAIQDEFYWGSNTQNGTVNAKRVAGIRFQEDQTLLTMENLTAFSSRYFRFQMSTTGLGSITGSVNQATTTTSATSGLSGTLVNNSSYQLNDVVINVGDQVALLSSWMAGETIDLEEEQKNGRVHMMTRDQFFDGAYENRGDWDASLSDYYEYFLYAKNDQSMVMGWIDETMSDETMSDKTMTDETMPDETMPDETMTDQTITDEMMSIQKYTDYPMENDTIVRLTISEK